MFFYYLFPCCSCITFALCCSFSLWPTSHLWTVVLLFCVCTVNIVFLWLSATGTLLYIGFCTLTNERSNERMPTRGQIWGQRQFLQLITISAALPRSALLPFSSFFSLAFSLSDQSVYVSLSLRECVSEFTCLVASGSFGAGVWSYVLSSIANKPSVTSIPPCVCVFVCDLVLVCFC